MINFHAEIDFKYNLLENGSFCQNLQEICRKTAFILRNEKPSFFSTKKRKPLKIWFRIRNATSLFLHRFL